MKQFFTLSILSLVFMVALQGQVSQNMIFRSNWDDNTLPNRSGFNYNDIWGYAADGKEYAILGAVNATIFIDITDPTNPTEITRISGGGNTSGVSLWRDFKTYDTYAYGVADETSPAYPSGLQIFDLSNLPVSVTKVFDSNVFFSEAHNIFIDETAGRLYAVGTDTRNSGVIILDLKTNPASPTLLASTNLAGGYVHDLFVRGDTAYCSHGGNGLYIYDMSNVASISTIIAMPSYPAQGYNHSSWLTDDGTTLVFADENRNQPIRILDVSNMANLNIISTFKSTLEAPAATNSIAHNPFIKDQWVFISYYHDGLQVYDISDPANPVRAAYYDTEPTNTNYNGSGGAWGMYPFLPSGNIIGSDVRNGLFVVTPTIGGLSIENVELTATSQAWGVALEWKTNSTDDFVSFRVEKSMNGEDFEPVTDVTSSGPNQLHTVWDSEPFPGASIYRLFMTDAGGNPHFSNKVEVRYDLASESIELFPNPIISGEPFYMRVTAERETTVGLTVFDLHGRNVFSNEYDMTPGIRVIRPEVSLPGGSYIVKMENGLDAEFVKVVVR